jgi:hypothetical protein
LGFRASKEPAEDDVQTTEADLSESLIAFSERWMSLGQMGHVYDCDQHWVMHREIEPGVYGREEPKRSSVMQCTQGCFSVRAPHSKEGWLREQTL